MTWQVPGHQATECVPRRTWVPNSTPRKEDTTSSRHDVCGVPCSAGVPKRGSAPRSSAPRLLPWGPTAAAQAVLAKYGPGTCGAPEPPPPPTPAAPGALCGAAPAPGPPPPPPPAPHTSGCHPAPPPPRARPRPPRRGRGAPPPGMAAPGLAPPPRPTPRVAAAPLAPRS